MSVAHVQASGLVRTGASRTLSTFIAREDPDVFAIAQVEAGDALAIATRFARQWAYRGGEALFWNGRFEPLEIVDAYLPSAPALRGRRGFLLVRGTIDGRACALSAARLHAAKPRSIPELRFLRSRLRCADAAAIVFAALPAGRIGLRDLGFVQAGADRPSIWIRGFDPHVLRACTLKV